MSRLLGRVTASLAVLAAVSGCVYYNGMYNAERARNLAERYEREGRLIEARDQWQRVEMHAESVVVRHPHSRWTEEARLLSGRALTRLGSHDEAVEMLDRAVRGATTAAQRAEALTLRGRANLALGRTDSARADFDGAIATPSPSRSAALYWRGELLLSVGNTAGALGDFAASAEPLAPVERARTLLTLRDTAAALAQLEPMVLSRPYDPERWAAMLDTLAGLGAGPSASALAGHLAARRDLTAGQRARLLLDDGNRCLARADTAAARRRFLAAVGAAPDSAEARLGGVRLALLDLPAVEGDSDFAVLAARLSGLAESGGLAGREAQNPLRLIAHVMDLRLDGDVPDARAFLRAELLRDSLGAVRLAAEAFAGLARRYPLSPWAAKALLAAIAAGHPAADSLRMVLDTEFARSPYRRAALGHADDAVAGAYVALEDSLRRSLAPFLRGRAPVPGDRRAPTGDADVRPAAPRPSSSRPDTLLAPASPW